MTQRVPHAFLLPKSPSQPNFQSQLSYTPSHNFANPFSMASTPRKSTHMHTLSHHQRSQGKRLSSADVGRITGSSFREGQPVKGESRISYVPYEKKVIDYETRTVTEMRPKTKKIIDYHEKKVIQNVPRQVVRQQYYPVQRVTKVCKQIVEMKPVEKKVKKLQYVPVEKKIVRYPENDDYNVVQSQGRVQTLNQGVFLSPNHNMKFQSIQPNLQYDYSGVPSQVSFNTEGQKSGSRKILHSRSPHLSPSLKSSKVQVFKMNPSSSSRIQMNASKQAKQVVQTQEYFAQNEENPQSQKAEEKQAVVRPVSNLSRSKLLQKYASTGKLSAANYV